MPAPPAVGQPRRVVAAIDQGTQSTRVFLYSADDTARTVVASHQVDLTQHYPHPG
jgi:glycerol kinase